MHSQLLSKIDLVHRIADDIKKDVADAKEAVAKAQEATKEAAKEEAKANATSAQGAAGNGTGEADKMAADLDKSKAESLIDFASKKVSEVVKHLKDLESSLKADYEKVEKALMDKEFEVTFDPESKEDVKKITNSMEGILNSVKEVKELEDKLSLINDTHAALDKMIADLVKVLNVSGMIILPPPAPQD
jgi:hypothetical protein